ncbi:MAG: AraC family transcriptional regulator [Sneathiella sp.]
MDNIDILSDIFVSLKLTSYLSFHTSFQGDYAIELPAEKRDIRFHLVKEGVCWVKPDGEPAVRLTEGELVLIPDGLGQVLASDPQRSPLPLAQAMEQGRFENGIFHAGEEGRLTRLLCGFFRFDEGLDHPVLANLPKVIIIRPADFGAEPWLLSTLKIIIMESDLMGAGSAAVLPRLMEILFIQITRKLSLSEDVYSNGFIKALSDTHLSVALKLIHTQPEISWTLSRLAMEAGMSRARFSDRFTRQVGMPAIEYLTNWRLMKARLLLRHSAFDMAEIAGRCGYASVPSFSNRFKRAFGMGPGAYRHNRS